MNHFVKLTISRIIVLLFLLFGQLAFTFAKNLNPNVLFLFHNAGETYALLPTLSALLNQQISYNVAAANPAFQILENSLPTLKKHLIKIDDPILKKMHPKIILSGTHSELQLKILNKFKKEKTVIISFYDSFHTPPKDSIINKIVTLSDKLLVTTPSFIDYFGQYIDRSNITAIGHPTLEVWKKTINQMKPNEVFSSIKIENKNNKKTLLFVGGYGKEYEETFQSFLKIINKLSDRYISIVALHPKTQGIFEKNIIEQRKVKNVYLAPLNLQVQNLVSIADLVICYQSTACVFAYALGYPIIYFVPTQEDYTNWLMTEYHIPKFKIERDLLNFLSNQYSFSQFKTSSKFLPENSTALLLKTIHKQLSLLKSEV